MNRELQQQIFSFFIEDARGCLVTLEKGLPSLPDRASDRELIDELYRVAHSPKGSAAQLEIGSVQVTALKMEDTFKLFREGKVHCDRSLEALLLRCYDTLTHLFDKLQSPEGLSREDGDAAIAAIEPVFQQLDMQMKVLRGEIPAKSSVARTVVETLSSMQIPPQPKSLQPTEAPASTQKQPLQKSFLQSLQR